jgi:hypothetical protein
MLKESLLRLTVEQEDSSVGEDQKAASETESGMDEDMDKEIDLTKEVEIEERGKGDMNRKKTLNATGKEAVFDSHTQGHRYF